MKCGCLSKTEENVGIDRYPPVHVQFRKAGIVVEREVSNRFVYAARNPLKRGSRGKDEWKQSSPMLWYFSALPATWLTSRSSRHYSAWSNEASCRGQSLAWRRLDGRLSN